MSPRVEFRTSWRKSSFSASDANCVEVQWRKSTFSASDSNCVEVSRAADVVGVRDSKNANGSVLLFATGSWSRLVDQVSQ